jgi:hypothetical protein
MTDIGAIRDPTPQDVGRALEQSSFSKLMRLIVTVKTEETWRQWGYKSFDQWASHHSSKHRGKLKRTQIYQYLRIGEQLGSLDDEELERIGVNKCLELTKLLPAGQAPTPELVEKARKMQASDLRKEVEKAIRRGKGPVFFGEHLDPAFRGLQYAPANEQGVVFLFGMIAEELGFRVECVRREYPDCIAKWRASIRPERWVEKRIEFEFKSSGFSHPPDGSDLIVCWENDLGKDAPLDVLELKSEITKLPRTVPTVKLGR